jgi:hypothetical protein
MSEITADFWGAHTVAAFINSADPELSQKGKVRVIREAYAGYCTFTDDEGIHPGAKFRLETLLRRDPQLSALMGCAAPKSEKARLGCGLGGATHAAVF